MILLLVVSVLVVGLSAQLGAMGVFGGGSLARRVVVGSVIGLALVAATSALSSLVSRGSLPFEMHYH